MEIAGRGAIVQINTQENPRLAAGYEIKGIPTIIFFSGGKPQERISGTMDKKNLLAWWDRMLIK